jgi:hypothetical protein
MFRLPLDGYSFRALPERPDIVVDLDHESGQVELTIEFEPNEMRPHSQSHPETESLITALAHQVDPAPPLGERLLLDEIVRLRDALGRIDQDVTRHLTPDDARALASMLVHYANETERPR